MTITFVDETTTGTKTPAFEISLKSDTISVRQLIEIRIREEILRKRFDATMLVKPEWLSLTNPTKLVDRAPNEALQNEIACKAFVENRLLVLLKEHQATSLDDQIALGEGDEVSFLRLIPLVGG